jgi:L-threonylcarbamoyladenylate synthase
MKIFTSLNDPEVAAILTGGGVGVLRTDTLYGLVGKADNEAAVQRIYSLKHRDEAKSPIVLIASQDQLYNAPDSETASLLRDVWPGKVSVIIPSMRAPLYIRRGNDSVAYRLPNDEALTRLVALTGPLVAPSANLEGDAPAMDIQEAIGYFGDEVDFYVDGGRVTDATPSQLLRVTENGSFERLR